MQNKSSMGLGEPAKKQAEILGFIADFRKKKKALLAKPKNLAQALQRGSGQAAKVAEKKIAEVKRKIGLDL